MTHEYARAITRSFAPSCRWPARRTTHERQSGFERELRGLFRRGTWIRGVLLSGDHSCVGGVPVVLSAMAGCADLVRLRMAILGLRGHATGADCLFCV